MIITIFSKVLGFGRELAISTFLGATFETDAYRAAMSLPSLVVDGLVTAIGTALIPVLNRAEKVGRESAALNKILSLTIVITTLVSIVIAVFARPLSYLVAYGLTDPVRDLAVHYMHFLSVILVFQILTYSIVGYLQKNGRFYIAASCAFPLNITIIAVLLLFKGSIMNLVWATVLGFLLQLIWVLYPLFQDHLAFRFQIDIQDEFVKTLFSLMVPIIFAKASSHLNILIDQNIASTLGEGSLSVISNATKLNNIFYGVLIVSFTSVLFPNQSKLALEESKAKLYDATRQSLSVLLLLIIPLTVGIMYISQPLVRMLFFRGAYTLENTRVTGLLLLFYAPTILTMALQNVHNNVFFALGKNRIPAIGSYIGVGVNLILNLILVQFFDIYGLAIASTLSSFVFVGFILYQLKSYYDIERVRIIPKSTIKYLIATAIMLGFMILANVIFSLDQLSDLMYIFINVIIALSIYLISLLLMRTHELNDLLDSIKRSVKRS